MVKNKHTKSVFFLFLIMVMVSSIVYAQFAYVVNSPESTISMYRINAGTGKLTPLTPPIAPTMDNTEDHIGLPPVVQFDPLNQRIYVVSRVDNALLIYQINKSSGLLSILNPTSNIIMRNAGITAIDPSGQFFYNIGDGNGTDFYDPNIILIYRINQNTGLLTLTSTVKINNGGQDNLALATSMTFDPSGRYAYILLDGNSGSFSTYEKNQRTGLLTLKFTGLTGFDPQRLRFDPSGKFAYITNYIGNTVSMYSFNAKTGLLTPLMPTSVVKTGQTPLDIVFDTSGKYAYVMNTNSIYGPGTISMYSLNSTTGWGCKRKPPEFLIDVQTLNRLGSKPSRYVTTPYIKMIFLEFRKKGLIKLDTLEDIFLDLKSYFLSSRSKLFK